MSVRLTQPYTIPSPTHRPPHRSTAPAISWSESSHLVTTCHSTAPPAPALWSHQQPSQHSAHRPARLPERSRGFAILDPALPEKGSTRHSCCADRQAGCLRQARPGLQRLDPAGCRHLQSALRASQNLPAPGGCQPPRWDAHWPAMSSC